MKPFFETHSSINNENRCVNDFKGWMFFSYDVLNAWNVLNALVGEKTLFLINRNQTGRILIFGITLRKFIPIHLYSIYSETEQVKVLEELQTA